MSFSFFDSSALAKRYLVEQGTAWVRQQMLPPNTVLVSSLTRVEVISAVARRHREGRIDAVVLGQIEDVLRVHFRQHYSVIEVTHAIVDAAVGLLIRHPLRAYDAVQLASAQIVQQRFLENAVPETLRFVCADARLLEIAQLEGLTVENPNDYP